MILFVNRILFLFIFTMFTLCPAPASASADWTLLIQKLVSDNFDEKTMQALFAHAGVKYEPDPMSCKLKELIKNKFKKPGALPARKHKAGYDRFLQPAKIAEARSYTEKNIAALKDVEKTYCVPKEVVVAILLVETDLEGFLGDKPAFNTLASMASSSDLEKIRPYLAPDLITPQNEDFAKLRCRQKSDWAYRELKALIRYASARDVDPLSIPGSIYGAIGICQFMPSVIHTFGIDADKDGHIDVFSKKDAFFSIANYLRKNGWQCKMNKNRRYKVVMTYNHSAVYANTVLRVAEKMKK